LENFTDATCEILSRRDALALSPMRAYLINLDVATDRRAFMEKAFAETGIPLERVAAIDGKTIVLPHPGYSETLYHRRHGRTTKPGEIGCYFAHLKAMEAFLASGESHGLICEDDLVLGPDFERIVRKALETAPHWNVLRLSGLSTGHPAPVGPLEGEYQLCVNFGRLKGAGAYLIDRKAAEAFVVGLLPMWLPWDHAVDREWPFGLRACCVQPFPCSQTDKLFRSSIQGGKARKLSPLRRWATTYPYQIVTEISRWTVRGLHYLKVKAAFRSGKK
jgi:glycosyl transferase family 25